MLQKEKKRALQRTHEMANYCKDIYPKSQYAKINECDLTEIMKLAP